MPARLRAMRNRLGKALHNLARKIDGRPYTLWRSERNVTRCAARGHVIGKPKRFPGGGFSATCACGASGYGGGGGGRLTFR